MAIVGAGMAGVTAGRALAALGATVTVFEKSRGPGGRMATRRTDSGAFDHGAQYFTARDTRFLAQVGAWLRSGTVERWDGRIAQCRQGRCEPITGETQRFVGTPSMNAPVAHLASDLDVRVETSVSAIARTGDGPTTVHTDDGSEDAFDAVILTTPPAQAAALLPGESVLSDGLAAMEMRPCWSAMVMFEAAPDVSFDGAFVNSGPLSWACRDSARPERAAGHRWVLHGSPAWSQAHLEMAPDEAADRLVAAFFEHVGAQPVATSFLKAHRWRYALAVDPLDQGCLWDPRHRVAVGGDWCHGSRVEGAFLSGLATARVVANLKAVG